MEKVNEKVENLKICEYIITNILKLVKKKKIEFTKIVLRNGLIHIDLDNCIYTLSNMMMYKRFIDKISYKYKIILKYMPKENNDRIINRIKTLYFSQFQVIIEINDSIINVY